MSARQVAKVVLVAAVVAAALYLLYRIRTVVGLVFIAISGAAGERTRRFHFPGDRDRVRFQSTQAALEMLRRGLLALPPL